MSSLSMTSSSMSSSPSPCSSSSETKVLRHVNDVCRLDKVSPRSETVKGLTLDDVIAEKKIPGPPRSPALYNKGGNNLIKTRALENGEGRRSDAVDGLSLADIIAEKKIMAPPPTYNKKFGKGWGNKGGRTSGNDVCGLEKRNGSVGGDKQESVEVEVEGKSLDDIIAGKKKGAAAANGTGGQENGDVNNGPNMNGSSGGGVIVPFIAAPLDVLLSLTEKGLVIQCEIGKIAEGLDGPAGRLHNWRVKYSCGDISVRCDSSRKNLAKQGAAFQFLTELKEAGTVLDIPPFKIPEACYYDPVVLTRLEEVGVAMNLGPITFETVQSRMSQHDYFTTTFFIYGDEFIESSFDPDHSKLMAAKRAYECYSGRKFPKDSFVVNEKCAQGVEYDIRETEATHVLTLAALPPGMMDSETVGTRGSSTAVSRKRAAIRKPAPEESKLTDPEETEMFVDESGQMYVRSTDGSNKIRKITPVTLEDYASLATMDFPEDETTEEDEDMMRDGLFDPLTLMNNDCLLEGIGDFDYDDL